MGRPVVVRPGEITQLFEPPGSSRTARPRTRRACSQLVDAQNVCGDQGEIQPLWNGDVALRLEGFAEGLYRRSEISQHERALDLAREVLVEAVAPYARDVLRRPEGWPVAHQAELFGQESRVLAREPHVLVYAETNAVATCLVSEP